MKSEPTFIAERALANHCPELLAGRADDEDSRKDLRSDFSETLCVQLARRLQPLLTGKPAKLKSEAGGAATGSSLAQSIGPRAANFLLECGSAGTRFLVSFDLRTADALTDRLFGGELFSDDDEVDSLAQSSILALERLALASAQAIAASACASEEAKILRHHANVARLEPFPRGDYCLSWKITAQQDGAEDWQMLLAAREVDLDAMLSAEGNRSARLGGTARGDPLAAPFRHIPIPLRGILSEFRWPLSRIAALEPGELIPIALARDVPLKIGQRTLARGNIGTFDDRVALRLVNHGNAEVES